MSKNLTRKGYALGALVALAASVFAGSPAYAADSVVLAANSTDKTLAAPADGTLTLNASLAPGSVAANISQLKYKVVNNGALTVVADPSSGTTINVASTDTARTGYVVDPSGSATVANTLALSLTGASATSTTQTVTVTAFIDSNSNSLFDDGEAFQTQTVSFLKYTEITSETTWTAPVEGSAASISAKVKFTNINNEQLSSGAVTATVGLATNASPSAGTVAAWSATNFYKVTSTYVPVKGTSVTVQTLINSVKAGTAATLAVTTASVDLLTTDVVRSNTAGTISSVATAALDSEFKVSAAGSLAGDAVKGAAVKFVLSSIPTLSSTVTVTVNGTVYTSATTLGAAEFAGTTDADGKVFLTVSTKGLADGDDIVFTASHAAVSNAKTVVLAAPTYQPYVSNSTSGTFQTVDGTAVAVNLVVKDQFGKAAPDATYVANVTATANNQATTATTLSSGNSYAAVVGGKVTLTILDNGTGVTSGAHNTYDVKVFKTSTNGVYGAQQGNTVAVTVKIVAAADAAAGKLVVKDNQGTPAALAATSATDAGLAITAGQAGSSTLKAALAVKAFAASDARNVDETSTSSTETAVVLNGVVESATTSTHTGVGIANATVTVSGTEMQFKSTQNGSAVYGVGSLTFTADASGVFQFEVLSHLAGKQTVTITSGGVSSKVYVNFAAAAEASASKVTVKVADGAAQFQAGRALDVTFTVTDKYGNPVALNQTTDSAKLTISQTGAGYLTLSGDQATGAAGTFASKLITNFGDLGTSTITATVDFSDTTVTDLVATNSSEFGVTDADVTVGGRAVYASYEFAKGKTVTVSVDGKRLYSKLVSSDAYTELKFTQKNAGKHVVTVRISGGVVYSETVVTTK